VLNWSMYLALMARHVIGYTPTSFILSSLSAMSPLYVSVGDTVILKTILVALNDIQNILCLIEKWRKIKWLHSYFLDV
jgi:hypothetical protein